MKFARLSALSVAMVLASAAQANTFAPLIEDGTLDLHLRNYFKKDTHKNNSDNSGHQWAQALSLNYSSGYIGNFIGFDLGGHYALKLKSSLDNGINPGLLRVKDSNSSRSYGKGSYAVKINLMDYGVAKYGRMFLDTPLLKDNYSRSLPSLTEAFYADGMFGDASIYGIWALKANERTEANFKDYMVDGNKEAVKVFGGGYNFRNGLNGLTTNLAYAQQDEYARRYYIDVGYGTELEMVDLSGDFKFGRNSRIGKSKEDGEDNSQNTWGLTLKAEAYQATVAVSYQAVSQTNMTDGDGNPAASYQTEWAARGSDMTGYFGPHDMMISSFTGNGQKSWGINLGYDLAGMVDGLSVGAMYAKGKIDEKDISDKDESEYNLMATYATPQVENLSISALYGKNTKKDKGDSSKETKSQIRLIVKYDMSVF